MRRLLALAALSVSLVPATTVTALAAPHEWHTCPSEATGTVAHNGGSDWIATNQSSRPRDLRISQIGSRQALVCVYRMFGTEYWIYKYPSDAYPRCTVTDNGGGAGRGFYCLTP
jgi:hypothetical protein